MAQKVHSKLANIGETWRDAINNAAASINAADGAAQSISAAREISNAADSAGEALASHANQSGGQFYSSAADAAALLTQAFEGADKQIQDSLSRVGVKMEKTLEQAHARLSGTLEGASEDLKNLSDAQATHIEQWTEIVTTLPSSIVGHESLRDRFGRIGHYPQRGCASCSNGSNRLSGCISSKSLRFFHNRKHIAVVQTV